MVFTRSRTYLTVVTPYNNRCCVAKCIFPKYSNKNVNCKIMDLNGILVL